MRTLTLLVFLGGAALAPAQQSPKTYTPEAAPRPNEETILNARVVSVDPAGARLTVRGVDVKADGGRDETFAVAAPAAARLAELKRGAEVLLVLRGTTVVEVKVSVASGGQGGTAMEGTRKKAPAAASARRPAGTGTRSTPRPTVTPQAGAAQQPGVVSPQPAAGGPARGAGTVPGTGVVGTNPRTPVTKGVGVIPGPVAPGSTVGVGGVGIVATPTPALYATPFPTPRPQPTPIPVGTPRPVLLPSEAPSPSQTPTPSLPAQ
jgi:hypothetical protein